MVLLLVLLALVGSGCSDSSDEAVPHGGARTYYESLDLSSPRHAVARFVDAFSRNDFMTVWLVFSSDAEDELRQDINLLQYSEIIDTEAVFDFQSLFMSEVVQHLWDWEFHEASYLFDRIMLFADRHDVYLIDLTEAVTVTGQLVEADYATVTATVTGIEGTVTFRMALSPTGRWRVHQVIVSDGDTTSIAWP